MKAQSSVRQRNQGQQAPLITALAVVLMFTLGCSGLTSDTRHQTGSAGVGFSPAVEAGSNGRNVALTDPADIRKQIEERLDKEAHFHQPGIAYDEKTGLTFDGHLIDFHTGHLRGGSRKHSAASKESLHLNILGLVVTGNPYAERFIASNNFGEAVSTAVRLLEKKISSYEEFDRKYPGFGGFLPWFQIKTNRVEATAEWTQKVPGLDNGQFAWSVYFVYHALEEKGYAQLATRYKSLLDKLSNNAVTMFYDPSRCKVRSVAAIANTNAPPSEANYSNASPQFLDDPYEGELMVFFMTLFGRLEDNVATRIWDDKRKRMTRVEYSSPKGNITVEKGWWYSSHEKWKYLVLPYTDDPRARTVFLNGEIARTWHSTSNKIPGLLASVNNVTTGNDIPAYASEVGIPKLATIKVEWQNIVSPYASFPVILADRKVGLEWFKFMCQQPKMDGPYGVTEAISMDGTKISPILTWDGKMTTVLAMMGGVASDTARYLKVDHKYDHFLDIVRKQFEKCFPDPIHRVDIPLSEPTNDSITTAKRLPGFTDRSSDAINLLNTQQFQGTNALFRNHAFRNGLLFVPKGRGFVSTATEQTDLLTHPVLEFRVKTPGGGAFIEFKNTDDVMMSDRKMKVVFPNTHGAFSNFWFNVSTWVLRGNTTTANFTIADTETPLIIESCKLMPKASGDSEELTFDGRRYLRRGVPPEKHAGRSQMAEDLLCRINFIDGGYIGYRHNSDSLQLWTSDGYIWAMLPRFDIRSNRFLNVCYRSQRDCELMLELKSKPDDTETEEIPLIGTEDNSGLRKLELNIPNSHGVVSSCSVDLSRDKTFSEAKKDYRARVIAFSDPRGAIEIFGLGFADLPRAPLLAADSSETPPAIATPRFDVQSEAGKDKLQFDKRRETGKDRLQFDMQGEGHYSRFNFTDIKIPYDGMDAYAELKTTYWLDEKHTFSPYLDLLASTTSRDEFFWQRYAQAGAGLQYYPFYDPKGEYTLVSPVRLFGLSATRGFYDKRGQTIDHDVQAGMDYYYDNLFDQRLFTFMPYMNVTYRETNFSLDDYRALFVNGNFKVGPKFTLGDSILLVYAVTDWAYVPQHLDRWWENYFRAGGGIHWYPVAWKKSKNPFIHELLRRFYVYGEVLDNVAWLGSSPSAGAGVRSMDYRVGLGFSTGGFYRDLRERGPDGRSQQ